MSVPNRTRDPMPEGLTHSELVWVLQRLPIPVVVLAENLVVRQANLAAQRLSHELGARLRRGYPLVEIGSSPSLQTLARQLFRRRTLTARKLEVAERHLVVEGVVHRNGSLGVMLIKDVTAQERRGHAEEDFLVN